MSKKFNKAMFRRMERKNVNIERDPKKKGAKTYKKFGGFKKEETPTTKIKIDLTFNIVHIFSFLLIIWFVIMLIKG